MLKPLIRSPRRSNWSLLNSLASNFLIGLILISCGTIRNAPKYELGDGAYDFRQPGSVYIKTNVYVTEDTVRIFSRTKPTEPVIPDPHKNEIFLKRSFDVDVMTIAFKYRPGSTYLPRQLNTDFNGNVFMGYRFDRFEMKLNRTPVGIRKTYRHRGITAGGFAGIGATAITPWTTNNQIGDEYNGFILSRGAVVMIGFNNLTVGGGLGWDYLTDRDKEKWIYQNKRWYGLTIGLNIN
jgi:hypothetical protein